MAGDTWQLTELEHGKARGYPREATLPAQVLAWAARTPNARAIVVGQEVLTYRQLVERATRLAHGLRECGVSRGDVVAVHEGRSTRRVVTYLAILMAGAAYLPLDDLNPPERNLLMVRDSGAVVVLASDGSGLAQSPVPVVEIAAAEQGDPARAAPLPTGAALDVAYVMYTSGSTGVPKGIAIPHRAITRTVVRTDYVDIRPGDVVAHGSNASFDAATFEIWGALLNGGTVVALDTDDMLVHQQLSRFVVREEVSFLFLTSAVFHAYAHEAPAALGGVPTVLTGGEVLDPGAVGRVLSATDTRVLNMYGPAEATTFSTGLDVRPHHVREGPLAIGRPIAHTQVAVLDGGRRVQIGEVGELHIGGDGLARGYVGRDDLTAERFVADPLDPRRRLYRTGDSARWRPDGTIDFLGRMDEQVKLRGFRIELGEIEAALRAHPHVADACVVVQGTGHLARLVGYVATGPAHACTPDYAAFLGRSLPPYMLPTQVFELAHLPRTSNGKIDRSTLGGRPPVTASASSARTHTPDGADP